MKAAYGRQKSGLGSPVPNGMQLSSPGLSGKIVTFPVPSGFVRSERAWLARTPAATVTLTRTTNSACRPLIPISHAPPSHSAPSSAPSAALRPASHVEGGFGMPRRLRRQVKARARSSITGCAVSRKVTSLAAAPSRSGFSDRGAPELAPRAVRAVDRHLADIGEIDAPPLLVGGLSVATALVLPRDPRRLPHGRKWKRGSRRTRTAHRRDPRRRWSPERACR